MEHRDCTKACMCCYRMGGGGGGGCLSICLSTMDTERLHENTSLTVPRQDKEMSQSLTTTERGEDDDDASDGGNTCDDAGDE